MSGEESTRSSTGGTGENGKNGKKRVKWCYDENWIKSVDRSKKVKENYIKWRSNEANTKKFLDGIDKKLTSEHYYIRRNDFPYDTPGTHYVMWLQDKWYCNEEFIIPILERKFPSGKVKAYINPPEKQSIVTIPHAHVFVKEKKRCAVQ